MREIPKTYNAQKVEDKIYQAWEASGFFNPDNLPDRNNQTYSIALPPPNVTGKLHLGHSVMLAIQDILIRYHRMKGDQTLWLPGTDHAAIATQTVVEKILKKEGLTRHQLGREKFLKRVEKFIDESKDTIHQQIRQMGASLDWSRERYTLDKDLTKAVRTIFKRMYNDGLIYRGYRIVNWCPRCASTLADDEVEYKEEKTKLYTFKYSKDFPFSIATTRPETKVGDTAIAVNPKDKRFKKYIGQNFAVDFVGVKLNIKIVADEEVDMAFGTGAVGLTPAHSAVDFAIAQKNKLPVIKVIDEKGEMTDKAGPYAGLPVIEAREKIIANLKKAGLLEKEEEITHSIALCYRCDSVVEPLTSEQWFVDVNKKIPKYKKSLKEMSIEAVKKGFNGRKPIRIIPDRFTKSYFNWMENLHDWCISRQIWFGHQIPVWYKKAKKPVQITYFVHGTTTDNEKNKASGQADVGLSEKGLKQAKELKRLVKDKKFDAVFCSDLKRAVDSAKIVFGDKFKIIKDKRLRECDYGKMTQADNKKIEKIKKEMINKSFPDGESCKDVENRIKDFVEDIIDKYAGKKIAIVAHKFPQLALEVLLNKKTWAEAIDTDWRKRKKWQPGWDYQLTELVKVSIDKISGWEQDPDTLDTWFSSGLWTFSTLGWPEQTKDLKKFHPTSCLETAYDILFFWVARMILMTTYALGDIPFYNVYLHGMVCDKSGKKMSKSKPETCIDPIMVIKKFGADVVRLSMIIGTTPGNNYSLYEEKIIGYRNFINKLWNISRFIISSVDKPAVMDKRPTAKTLADQWILSELDKIIDFATKNIENYNLAIVGEKLYEFTWTKLADYYLEIAKIEKNKDEILLYLLTQLLKLWHPFIPFITEHIWGELLGSKKMLMIAPWPKSEKSKPVKFELVEEIMAAIRNSKDHGKIKTARLSGGQAKKLDVDKEIKNLENYIAGLKKKIGNKEFTGKAPKEVVAKEKEKLVEAESKLNKLKLAK